MYNFEKIRKLQSEGKNKSEIARALGIDWKTVAKYVDSDTPPTYSSRTRPTQADKFKGHWERVHQLLDLMPDLSDREVYEYLTQDGYQGSERTVNRRLKSLRDARPKERFFEQKYLPAEQSQFDFKEKVELPFKDGPRVTYLHVATLPYSSTARVRAYPSTNYECYLDGIHNFFSHIGGRTENVRIDNLSACVAKILQGHKRKWTKAFRGAIEYYGFGVLPCSPGRGNEKGDVERDIRTLISRIRHLIKIEKIIFNDWDDANNWLLEVCLNLQTAESKSLLEEEKKSLLRLASINQNVLSRTEMCRVSSFGTVRVLKSSYSVADLYIGQWLCAVPGPYEINIYRGSALVATHPRKPEGENSILLEHVLPSLVRKPGAMVRWVHRDILFPSLVFKKYFEKLTKADRFSAEREFLKSVNLIHHASLTDIEAGMQLVMEHNHENYFNHLKDLVLTEHRPGNVYAIKQNPLKPNLIDYDDYIPKPKTQKEYA